MKTEIERRFLVNEKRLPSLKNGKLITQAYLAKLQNHSDPLVRVRIMGKEATLTAKLYRTDLTRDEFEYPIPLKDAEKISQAAFAAVQKIRYSLRIGKHIWTVDVYEGDNFPLIIAEIELASESEKFEVPLWVTKEVSNDTRFHAYSLAIKPFTTWKKRLTR